MSSFTPVLSIRSVFNSFYLLISYFEKFSTESDFYSLPKTWLKISQRSRVFYDTMRFDITLLPPPPPQIILYVIFQSTNYLAWENSQHFVTAPLVSQRNDVWETSAEIPYWWGLVEANFPHGTTNQKHYPDLGSDVSSVWSFCSRFLGVISQGNQWCREMSAFFSG